MAGIPSSSAAITADYLTEAFRSYGSLADTASVDSVSVEQLAAGVGFMGEVTKLHLTYTGDGTTPPASVIAKIPTQEPTVREMMKPTRVFERESRFYAELNNITPMRTPECYLSAFDLEADEFLLIMQDLSAMTEGDQVIGCSADQAAMALEGLALHHAAFWNGNHIADLDYVPVINGDLNKAGAPIYEASLPGFKEVFGHLVHPNLEPMMESYSRNNPDLLDRFAAMPHTLVHFDFRADNLFFDDAGVAAFDFQSISRGGGAADVGYFLSQNLSVETRRAHEKDLLATYHAALESSGVSGYSLEQFTDDYRVGVIYGWIIPVFAVGTLDSSSERAMALWTEVIERTQVAIEDHDATSIFQHQ